MYNPHKITKDEFKILIKYIEKLKGKSRNDCIDNAREIEKEEVYFNYFRIYQNRVMMKIKRYKELEKHVH